MRTLVISGFVFAALLCSTVQAAEKIDPEVQALQAQLQALNSDPSLADLAGLQRLKAQQALDVLRLAKPRDRSHALYVAEQRLAAAKAMAEAEMLRRQAAQLDREFDQLTIEASRRDAERARQETERLRLQSLAREEAAERALQSERVAREQSALEAEQAQQLAAARAREAELARQEAELAAEVMAESTGDAPLPPKRVADGQTVYTLAGNAFASGKASLTPSARASLRSLGALLAASNSAVVIEGHSDGQGDAAINQKLSQRRAEAVQQALADAGVDGSRMQATGLGQAQPIADNSTADGRAQNRRVEIKVD